MTALGIFTAVIMLSATALYSAALAEAGVRHALFSEQPGSLHIQILAQNRPLGPEDYAELRGIAEETAQRRIGLLTVNQERFGRTQTGMAVTTNPVPRSSSLGAPSGRPFFMTGFVEHSRILEGNWPRTHTSAGGGTSGPDGVEMEAVVGRRVAKDMGYEVGTKLFITPFRAAPEKRIILNIVGVADPIDPREEYWLGAPNQFSVQTVGEMLVVPAYITEEDFLQVLGRRFPTAVGDFGFNLFVDPAVITAGTVEATQEALSGLETDLNKSYPRTFVFSRLGLTLEEFKRDLTLARVPIYVFISLVFIIVLYFLALITGILGRGQADELGLMRSRGASVIQVCGVLLLVESIIALAAVAIGPMLAWLIVRFLLLPTFGELDGGPIQVVLSGDMYWTGAAGAILSVAVLAISAAGRARTTIADTQAGRSRPPAISFFHRYYLDLVAVLVAGLVWWQFQQQDGFASRALASRGLEVDPVLILAPVLALLTAALLLMRVLPLLVRSVVWLCMRAGPGWSSVTLARLARDPVLPSSLAVLLMLAAALGVFGATFQSSLSRSQSDQTLYRIGGDAVVSGPGVTPGLADSLASVPGVQAATPILRDSVSLIEGHTTVPALLIAADLQAMAQSAWFRDDFANATLPELASHIHPSTGSGQAGGAYGPNSAGRVGVPLPSGIERIGVWLETGELNDRELQANINVWARLADTDGRYRNVSLGRFGGPRGDTALISPLVQESSLVQETQGWQFIEGELPERLAASDRQLFLTAIFFSTSSFARVAAARIHIDGFTAFGSSLPKEGVVLEEFDTIGNWKPLGATGSVPDSLTTGPPRPHKDQAGPSLELAEGVGSLTFSWEEPFRGEQRGIHISPVSLPLPAIGGAGLHRGQTLRIEHGRASIPIEVVEVSDFFPTVTNFRRPFLLLDINGYLSYLRFLPPGSGQASPQEIWLSLDPAYDRNTVTARIADQLPPLASVTDRQAAATDASRNPLAGGGWNGLTGLSMTGIGLVVLTALLLHSGAPYLYKYGQAGSMDTAVARALGMSKGQLFFSMVAEKWLMGGAAIVIGAVIGYWPGLALVRLLDPISQSSASRGASLVPPMIPEVHGVLLFSVLIGLIAALTASAVFAAFLAQRAKPVDALRGGS